MKPYPFIQYMTVKLVEGIDKRLEKKQDKNRSKRYRSRKKRVFSNSLFGMIPFAIHVEWKKRSQKLRRRKRIRT